MLTIYDAVDWPAMPHEQPILVYVDDPPAINTEAAIVGLTPSVYYTVTALGKKPAVIADVESHNMAPARAAMGVKLGWWDTIYCSLDTLPSVKAEMIAQGSPKWHWFAADPTGEPHLPPGAVACQYAWHSLGQVEGNYDMSCALLPWADTHCCWVQQLESENTMQATELTNGRIVTPTVGAQGSPNAGHLLLWFTNQDGTNPSVIDATLEVGNKGPGETLYTVQP